VPSIYLDYTFKITKIVINCSIYHPLPPPNYHRCFDHGYTRQNIALHCLCMHNQITEHTSTQGTEWKKTVSRVVHSIASAISTMSSTYPMFLR
jgi:hypothetical protein